MHWRLESHSSASGNRQRLICIIPNDESWYYGEINRDELQPNGLGAHYTKDGKYIQGGYWEHGVLKNSMPQDEYRYYTK